jgi:hypothetical protein
MADGLLRTRTFLAVQVLTSKRRDFSRMASLRGESSNPLFETLREWNGYLLDLTVNEPAAPNELAMDIQASHRVAYRSKPLRSTDQASLVRT